MHPVFFQKKQGNSVNMNEILNNIILVRRRIEAACARAGRDFGSVRLLLAVKTVDVQRIRLAIEAGETLIGENKMQEFALKNPDLLDLNYEKHFIGHLQTNKAKDIVRHGIDCLQSLDSVELMQKLDRALLAAGRSLDIMVQVNTSREASKSGLSPDGVADFLRQLRRYDTLKMKGFMTVGLFDDDTEAVRRSYTRLKMIRDNAIADGLIAPDSNQLSMGMSGDLETAIEEGATMLRIGSAIFGARIYNQPLNQ